MKAGSVRCTEPFPETPLRRPCGEQREVRHSRPSQCSLIRLQRTRFGRASRCNAFRLSASGW